MSLKDQMLNILDHSQRVQRDFVAGLSDEERGAASTYEKWSAKDMLAHISYWKEQRARRMAALARGEDLPASPPNYEQANYACYQEFCDCSWEEVQAYADEAHQHYVDAVKALDEDVLAAPVPGAYDRPVWMDAVGTGYTHPLVHMAGYYSEHGKPHKAGELWKDWGELVSPLDESPNWQGTLHYNLACSYALLGDSDQAISELRRALELRPSLTSWSRQDSDLSSLHGIPEYRELYAPAFWWKAMDAGPAAEALADQFMRALGMFRGAVKAFPAEEWRVGDTPYQRPAGLALHLVESVHGYCALAPGESPGGRAVGLDVAWDVGDSSKLPSQEDLLAYLDDVERSAAHFLAEADLMAAEELSRWTGSTMLSRAIYSVRHVQHHLAEMCLELHRRGIEAPDWE